MFKERAHRFNIESNSTLLTLVEAEEVESLDASGSSNYIQLSPAAGHIMYKRVGHYSKKCGFAGNQTGSL
jgi:hypothetical protein